MIEDAAKSSAGFLERRLRAKTRQLRRVSKACVPLLMTGLAVHLQGCGVFTYEVSVPGAVPYGVQGRIADDVIDLTLLPDMHLGMQVRNHTSSTSLPHQHLGVLLWVKSKSSDETFSFDPGRVVLRFGNGEEVRVSSYGGPELLRANPRGVGPSCGWATQRLQVRMPQGPVPFRSHPHSGACFMLWFETSAIPDRDFTLVVDEVKRAGEKVAIPPIEFKQGSVQKFQTVFQTALVCHMISRSLGAWRRPRVVHRRYTARGSEQ